MALASEGIEQFIIAQDPTFHQELITKSIALNHTYSLEDGSDRRLDDLKDVEAIYKDVTLIVQRVDSLNNRATHDIKDSKQYSAYAIVRAYSQLGQMSFAVVRQVREGPPDFNNPKLHPQYRTIQAVKQFDSAVGEVEYYTDVMYKLQENFTEVSAKFISLSQNLKSAKRFLDDHIADKNEQIEENRGRLAKLEEDLKDAKSRYDAAEAEVEKQKEIARRLERWGDEGNTELAVDRAKLAAKAAREKRDLIQQQWDALDGIKKKQVALISKMVKYRDAAGQTLQGLPEKTTTLAQGKDTCTTTTRLVVETKEILLDLYSRHLADIKALCETRFESPRAPEYCDPILRIVLLAPPLLFAVEDRKSVDRTLDEICNDMAKLPKEVLDGDGGDPDDYGGDEESLGKLLERAQAFVKLRKEENLA